MSRHSTVEFRDIPGFPGYKVGSNGTVWSNRRPGRKHAGEDRRGGRWRKLRLKRTVYGYLAVQLCVDCVYTGFGLHRLMLLAFVGPPPPGRNDACHRDDNKANNSLENLYWGTRKENMADAVRNGTTTKGIRNAQSKITNSQVLEIVRLCRRGWFQSDVAAKFGISQTNVSNIIRGKTWSHVTGINLD